MVWDEAVAERCYELEAASSLSPDRIFERRWALALFQQALGQLRAEFADEGKSTQFTELKRFLTEGPEGGEYSEVAARLQMTPGSVSVAVHRMRQRYQQVVMEEIAHTVPLRADVDDELRYLISLLSG